MAANKKDRKVKVKTVTAPKPAKAIQNIFASGFVRAGIAITIAALIFICYSNSLHNLFTNWDDPGYVVNDPLVKNLSTQGVKDIFSLSNPVMSNYHPLTILSYAIEYSKVALNPWLYHFDSVVIHILNSLLVLWFIYLLTGRYAAAIITALLFGLHPLHVESVAWVAGRKDVLYGFFFLAACISWVFFLRLNGWRKWGCYTLTILLFLCSVLSKPVAVSLPLVLWLIDYWEKQELKASVIINKIPFLLLALVFGFLSIKTQASSGSLATASTGFNILERTLLGFYALVTYLWKAVIPLSLRNFYPYPGKPGNLPALLYLYPVLIIALLAVLWKYARKDRGVVFGTAFFLINIALLLQFIPVGVAIVADRYSYISYIGLFFIPAWLVSERFRDNLNNTTGNILMGGIIVYALAVGYAAHERNNVWYNSMSLWTSNLNMLPEDADTYNNLGYEYYLRADDDHDAAKRQSDLDSAMLLMQKSVAVKPDFEQSYIIMAEIMRGLGSYNEALQYLNIASRVNKDDAAPYLSKAIVFSITQKLDSAKASFDTALARKPFFPEAHSSYGNYFDMTGQPDSALTHYNLAIAQNPDFVMAYLNRGKFYLRRNDYKNAARDFDKLIMMKPDNGESYYFKSICDYHTNNKALAKQDMAKAQSLGFQQINKAFYDELEK